MCAHLFSDFKYLISVMTIHDLLCGCLFLKHLFVGVKDLLWESFCLFIMNNYPRLVVGLAQTISKNKISIILKMIDTIC